MRKLSLILIALNFGLIVYFMVFKRVINWLLFIPLFLIFIFWYVVSYYVSKKMVQKELKSSFFFFTSSKLMDEKNEVLLPGALVITEKEILFYIRKKWNGGLEEVFSFRKNNLDSYEIKKWDQNREGLSIEGDGKTYSVIIPFFKKKKDRLLNKLSL